MGNTQARLESLLQQESAALENLHIAMLKEHHALKERNAESVSKLSEEKNILLNKLETLDKERSLYLQSVSHAEKSSSNVNNQINQLSNEIKTCLNKCKKQNNINGGIIEVSTLFNEKMLDVICGNTSKETTYASTGKSNTNKKQHSLGRV